MRWRKRPWIDQAIEKYMGSIIMDLPPAELKGNWRRIFGTPAPVYLELGTGRGRFIAGTANLNREASFIGLERARDILYFAAARVAGYELTNVRLCYLDIAYLTELFAPAEVSRIYINFCDPWPKNRHAKRRLTHRNFLEKYRSVLKSGGQLYFKTDNRELFEFSLGEFAAAGLRLDRVTFDLHAAPVPGDVMTEYEERFSAKGVKICRCEASFLD